MTVKHYGQAVMHYSRHCLTALVAYVTVVACESANDQWAHSAHPLVSSSTRVNSSKAHEMHDSLSGSFSQVVQIYLQPFWCSSLKVCVAGRNCEKFMKNFFCRFKVIGVDKSKKPFISACNYVQHVCAYLQQFSH